MTIYEKIIAEYPELETQFDIFMQGIICIQDDNDGKGAYLASWDYEKPLPVGLKIGK